MSVELGEGGIASAWCIMGRSEKWELRRSVLTCANHTVQTAEIRK